QVAAHLRELLRDSQIRESHLENDPRVQDAYSLRCMPQVHGTVRDALGFARIALTDLISICERRIDRLVNPDSNEDLPPFLTSQPGAASGFMMLQIVAASLLNEAKVLAHPASIDNVPTDGGKEDHVSMG